MFKVQSSDRNQDSEKLVEKCSTSKDLRSRKKQTHCTYIVCVAA